MIHRVLQSQLGVILMLYIIFKFHGMRRRQVCFHLHYHRTLLSFQTPLKYFVSMHCNKNMLDALKSILRKSLIETPAD